MQKRNDNYFGFGIVYHLNTLMHFWPILKLAYLYFYEKGGNEFSCGQKDNWTRSFFYKNITNLVFLWPNMGQKCFKVLNSPTEYHKTSSNVLINCLSKLVLCRITFIGQYFIIYLNWDRICLFNSARKTAGVIFHGFFYSSFFHIN